MLSDAPEKPEDATPSAGGTAEPSTPPEEKTYKQDEVDKLLNEKHSTLDKKIAGLEKQIGNIPAIEKRAKDAKDALAKVEDEKATAELDGIRDKPDALSLWQAKQDHKEAVRAHDAAVEAFNTEKAANAADVEEVKTFKVQKDAMEIAAKPEYAGVNYAELVELTDGTPAKMEALAKKLKTAIPTGDKPPEGDNPPPDSGITNAGGAGALSNEERENMPVDQYANHPSVKARFK